MNISILGLNIKKIREEKGISAYKLAKEAGVGRTTISEIETGKRQSLNTATVEKIAAALNVTTDGLFDLEPNKDYVVEEIEPFLHVAFTSDELLLDGKELTETEVKQLKHLFISAIDAIRIQRGDK